MDVTDFRRRTIAAGKTQRYEISVVEIAMKSTALNAAAVDSFSSSLIAKTVKIEATTPDMRFTRTGVPSRL